MDEVLVLLLAGLDDSSVRVRGAAALALGLMSTCMEAELVEHYEQVGAERSAVQGIFVHGLDHGILRIP